MPTKKPIVLDESFNEAMGRLVAKVGHIAAIMGDGGYAEELAYDGKCYTNVGDYLRAQRDGKVFSVLVPKFDYSPTHALVKADANSALACEPSSASVAGRDDYQAFCAFRVYEVNAYLDAEGKEVVTAIQGDGKFRRDGSNGDVWIMRAPLYQRITDEGDYIRWSVSDTMHAGFGVAPGGLYPDGTERPFVLHAKYAAGIGADGLVASYSGLPVLNRKWSCASSHTYAAAKGAHYSGKTVADDWYVKAMLAMKYATLSSQSVFAGCSGYTAQVSPAVAEKSTRRVVLTDAQAAGFFVGGGAMLGTYTAGSKDRQAATCCDVFDGARITAIETYSDGYKALVFGDLDPFDVETTMLLSTAPCPSGSCDSVLGRDGSPTSRTDSHQPFVIQGIETMVGAYEVLSDVIMDARATADGGAEEEVYVCKDCTKHASTITADYVDTGLSLPVVESAGWRYAERFAYSEGLLVPQGTRASSASGTGDGVYQNAYTSKGPREWLGLGYLDYWSAAGAWCVSGYAGVGNGFWYFAGRLSATGYRG